MANYCENLINISGKSEDIKRIKDLMESITKNKEGALFYETLLGQSVDEYYKDQDGSSPHIQYVGDFCIQYVGDFWFDKDDYHEYYDTSITVGFDSRWSPTLAGSKAICEKYEVSITHEYAESGCDFSGKCEMTEDTYSDDEFEGGYYSLYNELAPKDHRDMVNDEYLSLIMDPNVESPAFDSDAAFAELTRLAELDVDYVCLLEDNSGYKAYVRFVAGMCEDNDYDESTLGFSEDAITKLEEVGIKDMLFGAILEELAE